MSSVVFVHGLDNKPEHIYLYKPYGSANWPTRRRSSRLSGVLTCTAVNHRPDIAWAIARTSLRSVFTAGHRGGGAFHPPGLGLDAGPLSPWLHTGLRARRDRAALATEVA